jgi:hypothetical protein
MCLLPTVFSLGTDDIGEMSTHIWEGARQSTEPTELHPPETCPFLNWIIVFLSLKCNRSFYTLTYKFFMYSIYLLIALTVCVVSLSLVL